jgi:hypothetical protein
MDPNCQPHYFRDRRPYQNSPGSSKEARMKKMWGNMPAIDILKAQKNEGEGSSTQDFDILCAASGDLRNVFKTVIELPQEYTGQCAFTVNDLDFDIVARNVIMLMVALYIETEEAVPAMIHFWYSAKLPKSMLQMVRDALLPLLEDVCTKTTEKPDDTPLAKTSRLESGQTLRIVLPKRGWNRLKSYLTLPAGLIPEKAKAMRDHVANNPANLDAVHEGFSFFWHTLRTSRQKYRETGVLLPYGTSRAEYDTWNPTFL